MDGSGLIRNAELDEDVPLVSLYGLGADPQVTGHLLGRHSPGNEPEDLTLSIRQGLTGRSPVSVSHAWYQRCSQRGNRRSQGDLDALVSLAVLTDEHHPDALPAQAGRRHLGPIEVLVDGHGIRSLAPPLSFRGVR